jgi:hypothetical protein
MPRPLPPRKGTAIPQSFWPPLILNCLSPSWPEPRDTLLHSNRTQHTRGGGGLSSIPSDQNLLQSAETPDTARLRSVQFQRPTHATLHQHGHQLPRQKQENRYTKQQTRDFIICVRTFNPNFSFQYIVQTISVVLLQFMQHTYESALPVIFNNFLANLLGLQHIG